MNQRVVVFFLRRAGRRDRDIDYLPRQWLDRQFYRIGVLFNRAAFANRGESARLVDDNYAFFFSGDIVVEPVHQHTVIKQIIRRYQMIDRA